MSDIKIEIHGDSTDRNELANAVDKEIQLFSDWFVKTFNGAEPLARFEKAIIKTYLMLKIQDSSLTEKIDLKRTEATEKQPA